jgi:hypothetical protein
VLPGGVRDGMTGGQISLSLEQPSLTAV